MLSWTSTAMLSLTRSLPSQYCAGPVCPCTFPASGKEYKANYKQLCRLKYVKPNREQLYSTTDNSEKNPAELLLKYTKRCFFHVTTIMSYILWNEIRTNQMWTHVLWHCDFLPQSAGCVSLELLFRRNLSAPYFLGAEIQLFPNR